MDYGSGHLLTSLLQSLQISPQKSDTTRVLAGCTNTLPRLTNALNISLLTTQILSAPGLWHVDDLLRASLRVLGIFRSASIAKADSQRPTVSVTEWIEAIIKGSDERVPRWKHLLAPAGMLAGFAPDDSRLPRTLRLALEEQVCGITNLCVESGDPLQCHVAIAVLSATIQHLSEEVKEQINYDALLLETLRMMYLSDSGFGCGEFLKDIQRDVQSSNSGAGGGGKLHWGVSSTSYKKTRLLAEGTVIGNISMFSRLTANAIEQSRNGLTVLTAVQIMLSYSESLFSNWKSTLFSGVDMPLEQTIYTEESLRTTTPFLWQVLKMSLFSSITILQAVIGRMLQDPGLARDRRVMAAKVIEILEGKYFITMRLGPHVFETYNFVYLGAIDVITSDVNAAQDLVKRLSRSTGNVADNVADRCLDLFYLNTVEYLAVTCSPAFIEDTILPIVFPYLNVGGKPGFQESFEAAHSVMLSIVSSPMTAKLCSRILPFYVESLFQAFPVALSARQFRLAVSTLIKESSPPTPLSSIDPSLPSIILEIVLARIHQASVVPLRSTNKINNNNSNGAEDPAESLAMLSERDVCILALLDCLPYLESQIMENWLDVVADIFSKMPEGAAAKDVLRGRFWDMISGELDVERAQLAVAWWSNDGRWRILGEGSENTL